MEGLLLLTLFGSVVWFWVMIAIFLFICFLSDINENGYYAFGSLVIVSVVYYFYGDIKTLFQFLTLTNIAFYLCIGFIFATLRTYISSKNLKIKIKDYPLDKSVERFATTKDEAKANFREKLEGNVTRWWFMWPVSMLNLVINWKFIKRVFHFIYSKFKGYFEYIVELGMK